MKYVECSCESTLFETILTMQFDESEFRIWSHASKLKPEVVCIPVAKCLKCGRYIIPATSMMGKNLADPEVQAYAQLLKIAETHNNVISNNEASYKWIVDLLVRVRKLEKATEEVVEDVQPPDSLEFKEEEVVKTTKRSRKALDVTI